MHDVGCLLEGPTSEPTSPAACFRKFRQGIDARQLRPGTGGAALAERLHNAARPPPSPPSRSATAPSRGDPAAIRGERVRARDPGRRVDASTYYALQNGVWFVDTAPTGAWTVATSVPSVIYTIPASSPLHYVTYAYVY